MRFGINAEKVNIHVVRPESGKSSEQMASIIACRKDTNEFFAGEKTDNM